jgi:Fe2+ or Zn2+ uptake regulation protein
MAGLLNRLSSNCFMTDTAIVKILRQKGIYITTTRINVFRIILDHMGTINASQIQKLSLTKLDRVSVYRALQAFLKKGLIIKVPGSRGWPKYLIKNLKDLTDSAKPNKTTIYFICTQCGTIKTSKTLKHISGLLPNNHQVETCQLIIEGTCSDCTN